jgi:formate hydrogenlyase transcriptional activator
VVLVAVLKDDTVNVVGSEHFKPWVRKRMPVQRLAFDSVHSSDLSVGQYLNLLDLAQLALSQRTTGALFPKLALRLRHALNFDVVTVGLYDSSAESIRLKVSMAGEAESRCECLPAHSCTSGWVWKNQRSVLVQDLDTEHELPLSLQSLRRLGVRTYYVFPLTTSRHKVGAIGFGSLQVIPKTNATLEFLRRAAAMIAQLLDTTLSSDGLTALPDCSQTPSARPKIEPEPQEFDLRDEPSREEAFQEMVGNSAPLREVLRQVRTVAATDATVLLLGETGTGKELVARAVHRLSSRAGSKFVSINCTAIPTDLLESELFGHEKGAFTGAINRRIGRLELADRGTLLLDEVGDLPSIIQPKLLRVLQDKEFERLGNNRTVKVNVRLIAATNQDLHRSVAEGRFREDLFYRLNVFPIYVPPLRERKSDIPALVHTFVSRYANEAKKSIVTIPAEAMDALLSWNWPGNIRELQNLIQRCVILTTSSVLSVPLGELKSNAKSSSRKVPPEVEREIILQALKEVGGVIGGASGAANRLRMKRTTLYSKMKKLNISPVEFQD